MALSKWVSHTESFSMALFMLYMWGKFQGTEWVPVQTSNG